MTNSGCIAHFARNTRIRLVAMAYGQIKVYFMELQRIKNVIKGLDLNEKLSLCCGGLSFITEPNAKKRIFSVDFGAENYFKRAGFFAAGCTFDGEILYNMGKDSAYSAAKSGRAVSGTVDLGVIRSPMDAGAENMLSEDPVAVKKLAESYIGGAGGRVFGTGVISGGSDYENRYYDPRAFSEIYAFPLEKLGKKLGGAFMPCGALGGTLCSENKKLVSFIKKILPPDAPVVTFGAAVRSAVAAVDAGAAVSFGLPKSERATIKRAIENGTLSESKLDAELTRLISFIAKYYEDKKSASAARIKTYDTEKKLAEKSIVLLKNDGVLPLSGNGKIYVCGESERAEKFAAIVGGTVVKELTAGGTNIILAAWDGRSFDRETEKLLGGGKINGDSVCVVFAPHPVELKGLQNAGAVLFVPAEFPATLRALKDVLTGELDPCGKLPVTWAKSKSDYPCELSAPSKRRGMFCYESVFNGYRYFSSFGVPVLFAFGHGLSYSRFEITKPKASVNGSEISVDLTVKNVSERKGETVVFAFVESDDKSVYGVRKRLAGFTRVSLEAGETAYSRIAIATDDIGVFDADSGGFVPLGGKCGIALGFSAENIACRTEVKFGKVKNSGCLSAKEIPSYYSREKFSPQGTEIEKIMREKLVGRIPEFESLLVGAPATEKALKTAAKKLKKAAGVHIEPRELSYIPQKVCENISESD